jgi:hypothetical protein
MNEPPYGCKEADGPGTLTVCLVHRPGIGSPWVSTDPLICEAATRSDSDAIEELINLLKMETGA